jgi:hypothetical protein
VEALHQDRSRHREQAEGQEEDEDAHDRPHRRPAAYEEQPEHDVPERDLAPGRGTEGGEPAVGEVREVAGARRDEEEQNAGGEGAPCLRVVDAEVVVIGLAVDGGRVSRGSPALGVHHLEEPLPGLGSVAPHLRFTGDEPLLVPRAQHLDIQGTHLRPVAQLDLECHRCHAYLMRKGPQ